MMVAHIEIEAKTPLKIGSSEVDFFKDAPIQRDWNNLPMILGTSLAGVFRKEFNEDRAKYIFGDDEGSRVIFSNALLLDENEKVKEELLLEKSKFLGLFENLPIREHTAITHKGVAKEHSKFDEEVVFKGSRFKFAMEFIEDELFEEVISVLANNSFRIGGGSTKGFGEIEVKSITYQKFNEQEYIDFVNSLNSTLTNRYELENKKIFSEYVLKIKPEDFFIIGSGFGDEDADMIPVFEDVIDYEKKGLKKEQILIPASSIKGAISHRVAYYYNLDKGYFADKVDEIEKYVGENNLAVKNIFGEAKKEDGGQKGKILISDCFKSNNKQTKVFDHVAIDRFTGGAIDGALFQEKVIADDREYEIKFLVDNTFDKSYLKYFEKALKDIANARLPLGGETTKGHGFFSGKVLKDGVEI